MLATNGFIEIRNALLTYMQTTGTTITEENMKLFDINIESVIGCRKFYEENVKKL